VFDGDEELEGGKGIGEGLEILLVFDTLQIRDV
jgi:hypothetical protein